jgi:predicted transcriptional regulator
MSATKRRRRSPEPEDLAAAVADIINSPITRTTLNFLRPLEPVQEPEPASVDVTPMGLDLTPLGFVSTPQGVNVQPMGLQATPMGVKPMATAGRRLWQAEALGAIFEESRVRRIQRAQDALSLVEEKVYDLLWGTKNQRRDEFRLVHFSLQRISTEARINIKTVRQLIPRLIEKGFLQIEHEADVRRNIPTLYRVPSYVVVLTDQKQRSRFAVAKTGKGVFYVHPYRQDSAEIPMGVELAPVGLTPMGFDIDPMGFGSTPVGLAPIGPMGASGSKPMGASGPPSIDISLGIKNRQTTTTESFIGSLAEAVRETTGREADTALLRAMVECCHQHALETTGEPAGEDEVMYFTTTKGRIIRQSSNIRNHLAVLRKAVPECFVGEAFRAFRVANRGRKEQAEGELERLERALAPTGLEFGEKEARFALWDQVSERHKGDGGYDMLAIAEDPELDEAGKSQARGMIERLGRYSRVGL